MSLSSAINSARSGLQLNSLRADIVATNVANANTPGYVRRSVIAAENLLAGEPAGVRSAGVTRSQNEIITAQRRALSSDLAQANILSTTWASISARLGDTPDGSGLFQTMSGLESQLTRLAASPESTAVAQSVIDSAGNMINEFQSLSQMASQLRAEADREIASGVDVVNAALQRIRDLNGDIAGSDPNSSTAAALYDDRQRALDTIAEYLPIQSVQRDSGVIDVLSQEGVYLLAGEPRFLEFTPAAAFGPNQTLGNGSLSGLSIEGTELTPGAASFGAISSGMFGALFTVRDQDVPEFSAQLDTLAGDLVTRLSDDALDPTKTPGEFGLFVDPTPAAGAGLAARISLNAAIDPNQGGELWRLRDGIGAVTEGPPGNGVIVQNLLDAIRTPQSINTNGITGTFSSAEMAAHFSSLTGQKRIQHETVLSSTNTQHTSLVETEREETGVNIDAQMQDLLLIEQAYAANARVIEAAKQMIDRLMQI